MFYKNQDVDQRIAYVKMSNWLNLAYWQAIAYEYYVEQKPITAQLHQKLDKLENEVEALIAMTEKNLTDAAGTERELVEIQLAFVTAFVTCLLDQSKETLLAKLSGSPGLVRVASELEGLVGLEKQFIAQRRMVIDADDLVSRFDKGMYLVYEVLELTGKAQSNSYSDWCENGVIQNKLHRARGLFSLPLNEIYKQNKDQLKELRIDQTRSSALTQRLTLWFDELYKSGLALVHAAETNAFCTAEKIIGSSSPPALRLPVMRFFRTQDSVHRKLIAVNNFISRDILQAIDASHAYTS